MSHFVLIETFQHWISFVFKFVPHEILLCIGAVASGAIAMYVGRLGIHVSPYLWNKFKKEFLRSLRWQVKQVFERAKWAAHTLASARWAVLCAIAVSTAVALWIRVQLLQPLILVFVPLSLTTFFILAWRDRGRRATRSFRHRVKFMWAFFVPTGVYTSLAVVGAVLSKLFG